MPLPDTAEKALETDQTIDIVTTGRRTGRQRTTEIWFTNIRGRIIICGTPTASGDPGKWKTRDWLANLRANPALVFRFKESISSEHEATAIEITDPEDRREIMAAPETRWYRERGFSVDELIAGSPIIEIHFIN